jgi:aspartate-semialdehyde dehydrogenase
MKVGFVGWRGMVGSVLLERMAAERDFERFDSVFFSTSSAGAAAPSVVRGQPRLQPAGDIAALKACDAIVTCQGGDWTSETHPRLRATGWSGFWIDAASALRMKDGAIIVLDPVNLPVIRAGLERGARDFIGGNCTVSLMLMAIDGLLKADLVEWITAMTYQAASGAGAQNMRELLAQMGYVHAAVRERLADPGSPILEIDRAVTQALRATGLPHEHFGTALAGSLITWIDKDLGNGVPRGMEGRRRDQQDPRPTGRGTPGFDTRRGHLRPGRHDALPQPGADDQAQARCAARRGRGAAGRREPLGAAGAEPARRQHRAAVAGARQRNARSADRTPAQALDGRRIPLGVHRRRPVAVGRGRTAAPDVADPHRRVAGLSFSGFGQFPDPAQGRPSGVAAYLRAFLSLRV